MTTQSTRIGQTVVLAVALLGMAAAARAQDQGASVSGSISALDMDSHTSVAYTAAFDYRFTRVVGLEVEASFVPSLQSPFPGGVSTAQASAILPPITLQNEGGRAVFWSNNVRVAIPTTTTRLEPFFVAGGGVASLRHTAEYHISFPPIGILNIPGISGAAATGLSGGLTYPVTSSSTGLALTIGGGLGIKATSHLWIDADLRLIRILGDDDKNAGRFGVAARYRF